MPHGGFMGAHPGAGPHAPPTMFEPIHPRDILSKGRVDTSHQGCVVSRTSTSKGDGDRLPQNAHGPSAVNDGIIFDDQRISPRASEPTTLTGPGPVVSVPFISVPKARLIDLGGTLLAGSPADFGKLIADETERRGKVIHTAGIKAE